MLNKIITENETDLIDKLAKLIETVSNESIAAKSSFYVGLSGNIAYNMLISILTSHLDVKQVVQLLNS